MKLTDHLSLQMVKIPLDSVDKTEAITELVTLLVSEAKVERGDELLQAVLEREAQRTTGIGRGFAIPHAKCDAVNKLLIAFGRAKEPIDFAAVDGQPVRLIALLASPTNATSPHIQALAKLSRLVTNAAVMERLLAAENNEAFYKIIEENDSDA